MAVFGASDWAVRALSGLFSLAAIPLIWVAGKRLGGRRVAWAAVLLLAASPFAVRQATEARMYSIMTVLALLGFIALSDLLRRWTWSRGVLLALTTGAMLLTHYWSFYLIVAAALWLGLRAFRGPNQEQARRALAAMVAGGVLFVPWLPAFLYQAGHTGTPWGAAATPRWVFDTMFQFVDGNGDYGTPLGLAFYGLIGLAVFGRAVDKRLVEFDLHGRDPARLLAGLAFGALTLGVVASIITRSAYAARYTAVMFPLVLLLVAMGTGVLANDRMRNGVIALCVVLGLVAIAPEAFTERTAAPKIADALAAAARPGDVVAYCPDQLGPSVSRLISDRSLVQLTFPAALGPQRIDWVDYAERNEAGSSVAFAKMLVDRAGPEHDVWLVWAPGYRTFKAKCQALISDLEKLRPSISRPVKLSMSTFEKAGLVRYEP
ncbi:MAG: glycosyltransferase family 39 protein, partial [Actinomycetota bacterium]|nr:glycosyltransferase family 39 protein [Actinomycetota bacterium]